MMWARIVLWFTTSRAGQAILAALGLLAAICIAVLKVFSAGKDAERAKQNQQSLHNLRERAKTNDEVRGLDDDAVRRRLSRWRVRDGDGE
jgi:hypothetical protein